MRCVLLLLLVASAAAQPIEYQVLKEGVLQQRLRLASRKNPERHARLRKLFDEEGCRGDAFHEQTVRGSKEPNVICDVAGSGESPRRIIVGAHFDAVGGDGVIDNWSGAVLLPSLAQFMRSAPRRHAFEFVGFSGEEKGLLGSRTYVAALSLQQRAGIAAVITMDSLGLTPTKCWPNGSTVELMNAAALLASAMKLELGGVNVDKRATTDSQSFKDAGIPVLSLHSVTQEKWKIINGPKDVLSAVSWKDYSDSQRLISALLVYLDRTLP